MLKILRYILINGIFLFCLIYAIIYGAIWAENIAKFYVVVITVLVTFCLFSLDIAAKSFNRGKQSIPVWIDVMFDIVCTFIMVAAGWFILAGLYVFHMICLATIRNRAEELKLKETIAK